MAHLKTLSIATLALGALAGSAMASNTPISNSGEEHLLNILQTYYGNFGGGADINDAVLTSATFSLRRVADSGGTGPLYLHAPSASDNDQVWHDGQVSVSAQARFAGFHQRFGYILGNGGSPTQDAAVSGSGYGATFGGPVNWTIGGSDAFRWSRGGDGQLWTSRESDNGNGEDHMVTWQITDLSNPSGPNRWVLAWEDLPLGGSDRDYNDLVVEVSTVAVPTPTAALAGLGTLGLAGIGSMVRRRRQTAM